MTAAPQHWIATDEGSARAGNEDAFLWLGPEETGENGYLWLVVDGEGGPGVGNLAAAMVTVTVAELYGELLDLHGDPVIALRHALREADERLNTIAGLYERLVGVRASYAAVASYRGRVYPMVAGTAAAFVIKHGKVERIGEADQAKHQRNADDGDPVPGTGVGIYGGVMQAFSGAIDAEHISVFLCTDGLTEMVPEGMIAQGVERLSVRDAVEGLIELARRRWADDDVTAAVVRFVDPNLQMLTGLDAFLEWAESGMTHWPDKTLILTTGRAATQEPPPRTNVERLPDIGHEQPKDAAKAEQVIASTMSFSPEQVAAILQASAAADTSSARQAETDDDGTPDSTERVGTAGDGGDLASANTVALITGAHGVGGTLAVPPNDTAAARASNAPTGPIHGDGGTFFFSPQQMEQVRAAAEAEDQARSARADDVEAPRPPTGDAPSMEVAPTGDLGPSIPVASTGELPGRRDTSGDDLETLKRQSLTDEQLTPKSNGAIVAVLVVLVVAGLAGSAVLLWLFLR